MWKNRPLWLPLMQDAAIPHNSRPSTGSCVVFTDPTTQLEHGTEETAASPPSVYLLQLKQRVLLRSRASFLVSLRAAPQNVATNHKKITEVT